MWWARAALPPPPRPALSRSLHCPAPPFPPLLMPPGGDVSRIDCRIPRESEWWRIGSRAIQGNLEPAALLAPAAERDRQVSGILKRAAGRPGHIFNLGHGVLPETDVAAVRAVVDLVH